MALGSLVLKAHFLDELVAHLLACNQELVEVSDLFLVPARLTATGGGFPESLLAKVLIIEANLLGIL